MGNVTYAFSFSGKNEEPCQYWPSIFIIKIKEKEGVGAAVSCKRVVTFQSKDEKLLVARISMTIIVFSESTQ